MTLRVLLLILASVSLSAVAQLLMKLGVAGNASGRPAEGALVSKLIAYLGSPYIIAGFLCYGVGALLWLLVLARADLSLAYPFVGLGFIFTALFGALVLGETLTAARIAGTLLIIGGCFLVSQSA